MTRKVVLAIGAIILIVVLAFLLMKRDNGMTKVQRDIAESLERAEKLKAQRDSMEALVEDRRFARKDEVRKAEKSGETGEVGEIVQTIQTDDVDPGNVRTGHSAPGLRGSESSSQPTPAAITGTPITTGEGASVPAERFFTTAAMDGLTPQGKTTTFKTGAAVYLYAGVHAPHPEQLRVEWVNAAGQVLQTATVDVQQNTGSTGYRIYKYRTFSESGEYGVKLYNSSGKMIGSAEFEVQ